MGVLRFGLPNGLSATLIRDLERACVAGGYDAMPTPCKSTINDNVMTVSREASESGTLVAPFDVSAGGRLMGTSATLVEREQPYELLVELARGKINQLRCQAADWMFGAMAMPPELNEQLHSIGRQFAHVVTLDDPSARAKSAEAALAAGYAGADRLVREYINQLLCARHERQSPLDLALGARVNGSIPPTAADDVASALNTLVLPLTWRSVEPTESNYRWEATDTALAFAERNGMRTMAGPLIDFSPRGLPDWLWLWDGDLQSLGSFMCDYVETAVGRYRGRVRRWQLSAGMNMTGTLKLGEEDLLWLTARLAEAAWQVDPDVELVIGLAQPWGGYMARREYTYSPFIFADTLIRAGLRLAALELEWTMGITPRGSYCRDLLDASRQLDLYSLLGVPLQISLAYPAAEGADPLADPSQSVGAGSWRGPASPDVQADWASAFGLVALGKPFVKAITWSHLTDGEEHMLPHCGLLDPAGKVRPALSELRKLKQEWL